MSSCKFTRKISFPNSRVCLFLNLRELFSNSKVIISKPGVVNIFNKNPKNSFNPLEPIDSLIPTILSPGRMFVEWDVPSNIDGECVLYDSWENIEIENIPGTIDNIINKFFVTSNRFFSKELVQTIFDTDITPTYIYSGSNQYIQFHIKPDTVAPNKVEVRIISFQETFTSLNVIERFTGPGINFPVQSNALFPKDPVIVLDTQLVAESQFIEIPCVDNIAYFLLDTSKVSPGVYLFQLRITSGDSTQVTRTHPLEIRDGGSL